MKRYQYDQIAKAEPTVTRYKLYKSKKTWVVQGMTTVALLLGVHEAEIHGIPGMLSPMITTAHADSLNDQAQPETAVSQTQSAVTTDQNEQKTPTASVTSSSDDPNVQANTQDQSTTTAGSAKQASQTQQSLSSVKSTQTANTVDTTAQKTPKATVTPVKASVKTAVKVKNATDFKQRAQKINAQAQKVATSINQTVKASAQQAQMSNNDKAALNSRLSVVQAHTNKEVKLVKATLTVPSTKLSKNLTQMQNKLTQATSLLQSMKTELTIAKNLGSEVDTTQLYYGLSKFTSAQILNSAQTNIKSALNPHTIDQDGAKMTDMPFMTAPGVTFFNSVLPYWTNLQSAYKSNDPAQMVLAAAEFLGAQNAISDITSSDQKANSDQKQETNDTSFALILNVDEHGNPLFTDDYALVKAGDLVNNRGVVINPTNPATEDGATIGSSLVSPAGNDSKTYFVGKVGTEIANPTASETVPNFIFKNTTYSTGSSKLVSVLGGKTMQVVINHWQSNTSPSPTVTALAASVGDISKVEDGNTTFNKMPTVTITGKAGLTIPSFTSSDFDWSNVKAAPGTYPITLNATGIKKITDANANTTLVPANVKAGTATITPKTPVVTVLKASVGSVTKVEDGTTTFTKFPSVTVSGRAGLVVPTFDAADFDWSNVKATPGTYPITLNTTGIKKITDANANTTLALTDVTAGTATITAKTPVITAIKAVIGDVTKVADGTTTFTDIPSVTLNGTAGLKVPALTVSDFDWSKVEAAPGTYTVTLNASGIKKITDFNANTTLAVSDVTPGHATITDKAPVITAIKAVVDSTRVVKTYDGTTAFTSLPTVTLSGKSGLVLPTFTTADFDWSSVKADAGSYAVTLSNSGINKILTANPGVSLVASDITGGGVTINKAPITISANNANKVQGQPDPSLTATVSGLPAAGVTPKYTVTRTAGEIPGTYTITVTASATNNPNYTITVNKGTFTIVAPNGIFATVGTATKTYDGTATFDTTHLPKVTLTGAGDLVTPTFTAADFDWTNVKADAGTYSVTLNKDGLNKIAAANNGVMPAVQAGNVVIAKAAIMITANDASKALGQADPILTATVIGQPKAGSKVVYTITRTAGEAVGTYDILVSAPAADNPNYTITVAKGTFTISNKTADFNWSAIYVDGNGNQLATPVSGAHLASGDHYTTVAKYIDGYFLTAEPTNASGTISNGDVVVKYVYNKVGNYTIVTPNGQRTTIPYVVDHTDPTKVSVPNNAVVPYVSGYYAVGPLGRLNLVDANNVSLGYKLPRFITPGVDSPIVYIAINGGGGNDNGGGGNSGGGSNTPSNNNNGGNTNPNTPINGGGITPTPIPNTPNQPANNGGNSDNHGGNKGPANGSGDTTNNGGRFTKGTKGGQGGSSNYSGQDTRSARTNDVSPQNGRMRTNHLPNPSRISRAGTLPQTGESHSSVFAWIGAVLMSFLGLFGFKRRKRS